MDKEKIMKKTYIIILSSIFTLLSFSANSQKASQFRAKAEKGDPIAQMYLGLCYNEGKGTIKSSEKAFYWYHRSAQRGLAEAQVLVANAYREGKGVEKDSTLAYHWYERASESMFSPALDAMGDCFNYGIGVKVDKQKAIEWYEKAIKKNYLKSKPKLNAIKSNQN